MKEYGGYIELERFCGNEYHIDALALNSGRGAVEYSIRSREIRKMYLPYYLCSSVSETCKKNQVEVEYYHVNREFKVLFEKKMEQNEYIFIVNYFTALDNEYLRDCVKRFGNVIIDNTQAFYQEPISGADTIYNCRKYFGVPDGSYLYTNTYLKGEILEDVSFSKMKHILGRFEHNASEFYESYQNSEKEFEEQDVRWMSKLTHNLLRGINYELVRERRTRNWNVLNERLFGVNKLSLAERVGGYMYPLYVDNGQEIRKYLIAKKVYVPMLWNDTLSICQNGVEADYVKNILPLPIDQRYIEGDMQCIADMVMEAIEFCK